jgi:hypothetical protein
MCSKNVYYKGKEYKGLIYKMSEKRASDGYNKYNNNFY